jgi:hypothetical protein
MTPEHNDGDRATESRFYLLDGLIRAFHLRGLRRIWTRLFGRDAGPSEQTNNDE